MKTKMLSVLLLALSLNLCAQEKKPEPYSFGLGYGINFLGGGGFTPSQSLQLSVWLPKNFEVTFPLSFSYQGNKSSSFDSIYLMTNSGFRYIERTRSFSNKSFDFSISPGFLYHIPIKGNLDLYVGASIPISIGTSFKREEIEELSSIDYLSKSTNQYKSSVSTSVSGLVTLGCNYFFYKNLALGARASIGINAYKSSSKPQVVTTIIENSGADNPTQGTTTSTTTLKPSYSYSSQSIGFSGGGGFYLAYYFGMKTKEKELKN
jgi:hypothetical protein